MHKLMFSLNFVIQSERADAKDVTHEEVLEKINFLIGNYKGKNLMSFVEHLDSGPEKKVS
jgi:hypothetical protein